MLLEEKTAILLTQRKLTISTAESCSGGLLSSRITNIPGSSNFFKSGVITYSNDNKTKLLKVPTETLKKHGAVSQEVASSMAKGVRKLFKADYGISITGIAGPDGGTKSKPVGLTFIAVNTELETLCLKCIFKGTRKQIKKQATDQALRLLLEFLE